MKEYLTFSEKETRNLAKRFGKRIHGVVGLVGELGSGKTTFVQGFAEGLGIKEKIISPTFILIRQHKIPKTKKMLYHIDLYRLDFGDLGLKEIIDNPTNTVLIEWAEKIKSLLPKETVWINFEQVDEHQRKITIY